LKTATPSLGGLAEFRRHLSEIEDEQVRLLQRRAEMERVLFATPSATWTEAVERARYLLTQFAAIVDGQDPGRRQLVASVIDDLARLSGEQAKAVAAQ
jgi:hypothetical protein